MKQWLQWLNKSGLFLFFREIIRDPASIGAAIPSSKALANAMARYLPEHLDGLVVELGAGTGVITSALLEHGLSPDQLIVIERSQSLCEHLRERFPGLRIIEGDASQLDQLLQAEHQPIAAIVSSLPLRSINADLGKKIVLAIQKVLSPQGRYIQFTYSWSHEHPHIPDQLKHDSSEVTWLNLPPARIDVFTHKGA